MGKLLSLFAPTARLSYALDHIIKAQNAAVLLKSLNRKVVPRFMPNKCQ